MQTAEDIELIGHGPDREKPFTQVSYRIHKCENWWNKKNKIKNLWCNDDWRIKDNIKKLMVNVHQIGYMFDGSDLNSDRPLVITRKQIASKQIDADTYRQERIDLQKNSYATHDSNFGFNLGFGGPSKSGSYLTMTGQSNFKHSRGDLYEWALLDFNFVMSNSQKTYKRQVYDLITYIGDLGGVAQLVVYIFGLFVYAYA